MRTARWPLTAALLLAAVVRAEPPPAPDTADDEKLLKQAGVKADGPSLVEFFRKRVPAEVTPEQLGALVKQLGDDDFAVREKASDRLRALGTRALPALRRALQDADPEVRRRAQDCVNAAVSESAAARTAAAARVIAVRKPDGAAAALVAFLPFAENDDAADEVAGALVVVGAPGGRVDPAVSAALADKEPTRRAAAALLLGRHGSAEQKAAVRKLLADADPAVRLRAAQGLLAGREKAAVPVLLGLLAEAPADVARQADDLLNRAAGDAAPSVGLGETRDQRAKCRASWEEWWKANEAKLDLAKADVDLQGANPTALARDTARKLMDAWLVRGEAATARRLTDVPFRMMGEDLHNTRDKLDQFLDEVAKRVPQEKPRVSVITTLTADEYLGPLKANKEAEKLLAGYRKSEVRVVAAHLEYGNGSHKEDFAFVMRVSNGRARAVGLVPYTKENR